MDKNMDLVLLWDLRIYRYIENKESQKKYLFWSPTCKLEKTVREEKIFIYNNNSKKREMSFSQFESTIVRVRDSERNHKLIELSLFSYYLICCAPVHPYTIK